MNSEDRPFTEEALVNVLEKMLGAKILRSNFQSAQLQGGTVGDVRLVSGIADGLDGAKLPYKIVLKTQKKWNRPGDSDSWRREYDLYTSDFGTVFTDSPRWPKCYHAEMNTAENETQLWMEYIDGVSGYDLTADMLERAACEIGQLQGKLYAKQPDILRKLTNLSKVEDLKNYYLFCRLWNEVYDYIRSDSCEIPWHLREMLIEADDKADDIWNCIEKLPIVLCHRDFWVTNIFYRDDKLVFIDWDTAGWGYMGEDVKQLISDEIDAAYMVEYYKICVPAYFKGFSEYADISHISMDCIREMILVCSGYSLVKAYIETKSPNAKTEDQRKSAIEKLQKIYELRNLNYD
ncbi:MAG: aminoglycoside phosphotransferase family protein [Oscillospiraceae bacterium]|nr:aminoglycoside phosphotransferase family protein [Oscillospiraceae bacterium]